MYEDIKSNTALKSILGKLRPRDDNNLDKLINLYPSIPLDFLSFLSEIGAGEIGRASFVLYGGFMEPRDVYGETPAGLEHVLLFGDDMQGFCCGFDTRDWTVYQIDPANMESTLVASNFEIFIRAKLNGAPATR